MMMMAATTKTTSVTNNTTPTTSVLPMTKDKNNFPICKKQQNVTGTTAICEKTETDHVETPLDLAGLIQLIEFELSSEKEPETTCNGDNSSDESEKTNNNGCLLTDRTTDEMTATTAMRMPLENKIRLDLKVQIEKAFGRFDMNTTDVSQSELNRFVFFDNEKNYTRNLIATDHETYALMVLCWNKGKSSPIHDHPCDGCWVKVLQGTIEESRYVQDEQTQRLTETHKMRCSKDEISFMHDSMGLHKIGNPSQDIDAITLHLYAPPIDKCRVYFDDSDGAAKSSVAVSCYYSEFGSKV